MQGVTKQMSLIFPVMIFAFSFLFPQGLAIYWVTGTMFMVAQQYHLLGWNGLKVPAWFPGADRVTALTIPRTPVTPYKGAAGAKKAAIVCRNWQERHGCHEEHRRPGRQERHQERHQERPRAATAATPPTLTTMNRLRIAERRRSAERSGALAGPRPNRPNRRRRRR